MTNSNHKIFVYGTLKQGFINNFYLSNSKFICKAKLRDYELYNLVEAGYPFVIKGKGTVNGEVYEVSDIVLKKLDELEGIEWGLYEKHTVKVGRHTCIVYAFTQKSFIAMAGKYIKLIDEFK